VSPQVNPCSNPRDKFIDAHNYNKVSLDVSVVSKCTHGVTVLVRLLPFVYLSGTPQDLTENVLDIIWFTLPTTFVRKSL
jgi:hypothetical protein